MEKRYCKKCGRPLDKGDIDYCRGCTNHENKVQKTTYTNMVANDFNIWSRNVNGIGIIISIIVIAYAFYSKILTFLIVAFFVYCCFKATSLLLLAVAEIIQKLQNIENNTKNSKNILDSEIPKL